MKAQVEEEENVSELLTTRPNDEDDDDDTAKIIDMFFGLKPISNVFQFKLSVFNYTHNCFLKRMLLHLYQRINILGSMVNSSETNLAFMSHTTLIEGKIEASKPSKICIQKS